MLVRSSTARQALTVSDVSKVFPTGAASIQVLTSVSFELGIGEILAVVGRSGVGKTTLLNIIAGLENPTTGSTFFDGRRPSQVPIVFQGDGLFPWMTAEDNVAFALIAAKRPADVAIYEARKVLQELDLSAICRSFPVTLSGGMRKRVELARALVTKAHLILCDEPFSALDYPTRASVVQWFRSRLKESGASVLLVTHDLDDAFSISDRVIVLAGSPARVEEIFVARSSVGEAINYADRSLAIERVLQIIGR